MASDIKDLEYEVSRLQQEVRALRAEMYNETHKVRHDFEEADQMEHDEVYDEIEKLQDQIDKLKKRLP